MVGCTAPERSDDELHDALAAHSHALWSAHAALLADIGEHDRVEAWRRYGARSEEDYLVRYHQLAWPTAKDWVRQARVLQRHPEIAASYADGAMSMDKLSAACRYAAARDDEVAQPVGPFGDPTGPGCSPTGDDPTDPTDSSVAPDAGPSGPSTPDDAVPPTGPAPGAEELLALIDTMSAQQLAAMARQAQRASAAEADARYRRRRLTPVRDADERRLSILRAELFDDDAATVWAALVDYASNTKPDPETGRYDPLESRYADALVAMATAYLAAREKVTHHPLVFFHADARVLAGEEGWAETTDYSPLAADTVRRLACACRLDVIADDPDGSPLNLGRAVREATWQQSEVCRRRDGGCRMCGSRLFLQAHHVKWWDRDFGRTDVGNLVMTCSRCHHLLHEGGWTAAGDPSGEMVFTGPTGTVVRRRPHPQRAPGRGRGRAAAA